MIIHNMEEKKVFVPYRGFYFLNKNRRYNELCEFVFSSPIGAFIFLIDIDSSLIFASCFGFSSPIGAFIFLIIALQDFLFDVSCSFRPLSGLLFS